MKGTENELLFLSSPNGTVGLVGKPRYTRTEFIRLGLEGR